MNRTLFVLLLGLAGGIVCHVGWFSLHRRPASQTLEGQLAWMQADLNLTSEQLARIKALHEQSAPRLLALAAQVARMRGEFAAFEQERQSSGQIDFLEFARFVEQRRTLDRECLDSTRNLILASADVMNSVQREHYLSFLNSNLKDSLQPLLN